MLRQAKSMSAPTIFNVTKEVRLLGATPTFSSVSDSEKAKEINKSGVNQSTQPSPTNKEELSDSSQTFVYPASFEKFYNLWYESSGSAEISSLKDEVAHASKEFDMATRAVTESRREVDKKMLAYEEVHGRHASMLRVRDQWDDKDAAEFAELVGKEVLTRKEVQKAREDLQKAEGNVAKWQVEYMDAMRKRYHEEQIWQDKWRVFGTYGTWSLIGLNSIVFLASQYFHNKREVGRIKAIESLINEKLPASQLDEKIIENEDLITDEKNGSVQNRDIQQEIEKNSECSVDRDDQSITKEIGNVDQPLITTSKVDNPTTEEDNAPMPNTKHTGWIENAKGILLLPIQSHIAGKKSSEDNEKIPKNEVTFSTQSKNTLKSIHLPSAAVGAAATATVFIFALALVKR